MKTTEERLRNLKDQLESLYSEMPETHAQMQQRNKAAFIVSKEIERLENPKSYQDNKDHWEGHEIRL